MFLVSSSRIARIKQGELAAEITGVPDAEISLAVLKAPGGHKIELLQYTAPADRKHYVDLRPCDVGSVHVALTVDDLDAVLEKIAASGWKAGRKPQTLTTGPNAGKRVMYVRDPDGTTIEFMQPPSLKRLILPKLQSPTFSRCVESLLQWSMRNDVFR